MKKTTLTIILVWLCFSSWGQDTIKTMFYNLYRYPDRPPANRELILRNIFESYKPDLFMVCELINETGADLILNQALNHNTNIYQRAAFVPITSDTTDPLHQLVFFNTEKFTLIGQNTYLTTVRDINHYTFLVNHGDFDNDSTRLDVFVAHLKSSDGNAERQLRLQMVDTFTKALNSLPANTHVLFAGDFNFYSALNEPGYHKILDSNNAIVMVDPIDAYGRWNDNETYKAIHTQATRTSAVGFGIGGATGGLDDRFDFIMMSKNMRSSDDLLYMNNTYKAFGNNGNCFNMRIDDTACTGDYSLNLRQHLHNMSDHTPVTMELLAKKKNVLVGINTPDKTLEISFPTGNVVTNNLAINVTNKRKTALRLQLFNTLGQIVCSTTAAAQSTQVVNISTEHLANGIYILRISDNQSQYFKIVKQ